MLSSNTITVFTDGGAKNNGKSSCTAAWGVFFPDENLSAYTESNRILVEPTNQKAELYAIERALTKIEEIVRHNHPKPESIRIVTDSRYSIDCITKWYQNWEKQGWRTRQGSCVKHSGIIRKCNKLLGEIKSQSRIKVQFVHVRSHTIPPVQKDGDDYALWHGNYMVDKLVNQTLTSPEKDPSRFTKVVQIDWND
jgi:ribonuclease HI